VSTRDYCTNVLDTLKLKGVSQALEQFPSDSEMSHLEFLKNLLESEISYRTKRRMNRNLAGAHFPVIKRVEDFIFQGLEGISEQQVQNLLEFTWIDRNENLLFLARRDWEKLTCRSPWDWRQFKKATPYVSSGSLLW
jgi:DNA replication protein DnaC